MANKPKTEYKAPNKFDQINISQEEYKPATRTIIDSFLTNFRGSNRLQRGGGWTLAGGGTNTSSFLSTNVGYSLVPDADSTYSLGSGASKWLDVETDKINNATPLAGTKTYYVADSSGGSPTRKLTFINGILTSET